MPSIFKRALGFFNSLSPDKNHDDTALMSPENSPTSKNLGRAYKENREAVSVIFIDNVLEKTRTDLTTIVSALDLSADDHATIIKLLGQLSSKIRFFYQVAEENFNDFNQMQYISDDQINEEVEDIKCDFVAQLPEHLKGMFEQDRREDETLDSIFLSPPRLK